MGPWWIIEFKSTIRQAIYFVLLWMILGAISVTVKQKWWNKDSTTCGYTKWILDCLGCTFDKEKEVPLGAQIKGKSDKAIFLPRIHGPTFKRKVQVRKRTPPVLSTDETRLILFALRIKGELENIKETQATYQRHTHTIWDMHKPRISKQAHKRRATP